LNPFEISLIRFENRIGRTVLPTPPVSAAPTASPCRTQPLTIGPPSRPSLPVRRVDRITLTPPSSTVARQRAARVRCGRAAAAPTTCRHAALRRAQAPPPSLPLCLHVASTLRAPSSLLPLKPSHRPIFSSPARRLSRPSTPECRTRVPIAQASTSSAFRCWSFSLRAGLRPSVAAVRPSPVSTLRAAPFPNWG
jgi:hypothetical protein